MMDIKRTLLIGMLALLPLVASSDIADELRHVIIAVRPDLLTTAQKTFLRAKISEYSGKDISATAAKGFQTFVDGDGNTWLVGWWSVKQFRKNGPTVTLTAIKATLKENQYADRLKIAIAPWGQAEAYILSHGLSRPE